jgi:hypothetical protein
MALSTLDGAGRAAYVTGFVQSIEFDPNSAIGMRWRVEMDVLTVASPSSIPPEFFESVRSQSAGDRPMSAPALNSPGVVPLVGEGVTPSVTRHVRVDLELQAPPAAARSIMRPPFEPRE